MLSWVGVHGDIIGDTIDGMDRYISQYLSSLFVV